MWLRVKSVKEKLKLVIQEDAELARKVIEQDETLDSFNRDVYPELKDDTQQDSTLLSLSFIIYIRIARALKEYLTL
ncbi:hypothetical protein AB834_04900 [PVC group bacterium (ex Bugula neritina AB1)]|nr:hypothetical protein AB834_04900 [PVC group bacterium (ex Bugula neritina AB1)]